MARLGSTCKGLGTFEMSSKVGKVPQGKGQGHASLKVGRTGVSATVKLHKLLQQKRTRGARAVPEGGICIQY